MADTVNDRSTIENLLPGQVVQARMVTTSKNTCDDNPIDIDPIEIPVRRMPVADFTLPEALCPGESATVTFTGAAS